MIRITYHATLGLTPPKWLWACADDGEYQAVAMVSRYKDTLTPAEGLKEMIEEELTRHIARQRRLAG